jgi:hypothetical protein
MAKGVDELVNHVLSEIALTGVQGTHDSRFPFLLAFCLYPSWIVCMPFAQHALCSHPRWPGGYCSRVTPGPRYSLIWRSKPDRAPFFLYPAYGHPTDSRQELAVLTSSVPFCRFMKISKTKMDLARASVLNSWAPLCMRGFGTG